MLQKLSLQLLAVLLVGTTCVLTKEKNATKIDIVKKKAIIPIPNSSYIDQLEESESRSQYYTDRHNYNEKEFEEESQEYDRQEQSNRGRTKPLPSSDKNYYDSTSYSEHNGRQRYPEEKTNYPKQYENYPSTKETQNGRKYTNRPKTVNVEKADLPRKVYGRTGTNGNEKKSFVTSFFRMGPALGKDRDHSNGYSFELTSLEEKDSSFPIPTEAGYVSEINSGSVYLEKEYSHPQEEASYVPRKSHEDKISYRDQTKEQSNDYKDSKESFIQFQDVGRTRHNGNDPSSEITYPYDDLIHQQKNSYTAGSHGTNSEQEFSYQNNAAHFSSAPNSENPQDLTYYATPGETQEDTPIYKEVSPNGYAVSDQYPVDLQTNFQSPNIPHYNQDYQEVKSNPSVDQNLLHLDFRSHGYIEKYNPSSAENPDLVPALVGQKHIVDMPNLGTVYIFIKRLGHTKNYANDNNIRNGYLLLPIVHGKAEKYRIDPTANEMGHPQLIEIQRPNLDFQEAKHSHEKRTDELDYRTQKKGRIEYSSLQLDKTPVLI